MISNRMARVVAVLVAGGLFACSAPPAEKGSASVEDALGSLDDAIADGMTCDAADFFVLDEDAISFDDDESAPPTAGETPFGEGLSFDSGVGIASDPPYRPTCDAANRVSDTIRRIKNKYPGSVLIWLKPPKVTVSGTVPHRVLGVELSFVLIRERPEKGPNGGLVKDVEIIVTDFDAWASANGFERTQIDNIRVKLEKTGVAVSGDYTFKKSEHAQGGHTTKVVKILIPKGTNFDVANEHVADWEREGVSGDRVTVERMP